MQAIISPIGPSMEQVLNKDKAAAVTEQASFSKRLDSSAPDSDAGLHDLIWYNESTGETVSWTMDGLTIKRTNYLLRNGDWRLTHSADLNGDGQDDFIWEDAQHGRMAVWIMNGPGFQNVVESKLMLELRGWRVTHVADFNGDGKQDLIYRNPNTGQTVMWLMDGTRILESTELRKSGSKAEVVGVGDLDGDGQADLVWRNQTGEYEAWMMDGSELRYGPQPLATDNGFPVIPGRDPFVNDKHLDKPAVVAMASNLISTSIIGSAGLAVFSKNPGTQSWVRPDFDYNNRALVSRFLGAANLDGSGMADILFQPCNSWPCPSVASPSSVSKTMVGGKDWFQPLGPTDTDRVLNSDPSQQLSQIIDLNGDGKEDLVWRDRITGQVSATLMNGINTIDTRLLLSLPAWTVTGVRRSQDRPLARASGLASGPFGSRVDLDGRASIAKGPGNLSYEWVLKAPPGSQTQLLSTSESKTSFVADVAGSYTAELVVRRDGIRSKRAWFPFHATAPTGQLGALFIENNPDGAIRVNTKLTHGLKAGDLISIELPELLGSGTEFLNSVYASVMSNSYDSVYYSPPVESVQGQTIRLKSVVTMDPGADLKLSIWNRPPSRPVLQPGTYTFSVSTTRHPTPVTARLDVKPSK